MDTAGMMDAVDTMDEYRAALAVVGSMRESAARSLRAAMGADADTILASRITDAMNGVGSRRVLNYWSASGHATIETVRQLTGLSESASSLLVGAALHAQVLAGADVNEATVTGLAERAAAWDRGRAFGEATAGAHA